MIQQKLFQLIEKNYGTSCITRKKFSSSKILLNQELEKNYKINANLFGNYSKSSETGYLVNRKRVSPLGFVLSPTAFQQMQIIANNINNVLPNMVTSWHRSDEIGQKMRNLIKVNPKIGQILLNHNKSHPENVKIASKRLGTCRPDMLILGGKTEDPKSISDFPTLGGEENFKICEINARYSVNGYFISDSLNEAMRVQSCTQGSLAAQNCATSIPHMHSLRDDIRQRLVNSVNNSMNQTIWVIRENQALKYDLMLLQGYLENTGIIVKHISPREIAYDQSRGCIYDISSQSPIESCIMEAQQTELLNMESNVLEALLRLSDQGSCLNDLRTIFILHDKRMLSILSGYHGEGFLKETATGSISTNEQKNKQTVEILMKSVVPTVPAEDLFIQNRQKHALETLRQNISSLKDRKPIIYQPALGGKGNGIQLSIDFPSQEMFINEIKKNLNQDQNNQLVYSDSGIVQPFLPTNSYNLPTYDEESKLWKTEKLNVVGTLLCMDGEFYGPGIFRASQSNLVALSQGGYCLPATLSFPEIPEEARFILNEQTTLQKETLRAGMIQSFLKHGALLATTHTQSGDLDSEKLNAKKLENLVVEVLEGQAYDHIKQTASKQEANESIVWEIQTSPNNIEKSSTNEPLVQARSHTNGAFDVHTDASWNSPPPNALALSVLKCDRRGGGRFSVTKFQDIFDMMEPKETEILKSIKCSYTIPPEFNGNVFGEEIVLPVIMGEDEGRVRRDIMKLHREPNTSDYQFQIEDKILNKFLNLAKQVALNSEKQRLVPQKYVIIVNNRKTLHSRSEIFDTRRHLQRVRFSFQKQINSEV